MATSTDDNVADGNLAKHRVQLIWRRYTSVTGSPFCIKVKATELVKLMIGTTFPDL